MSHIAMTFPKGGVQLPEYKELTSSAAVETMPLPEELEIVLAQHIGAPCKAVVAKRSTVNEGDLLGDVENGLGVPVHSPVAGQVRELSVSAHPMRVSTPSIKIRCDREAPAKVYERQDWSSMDKAALLQCLHDAGIIGVGGAGFPTYAKLNPPPDVTIDTLILNGAECEPYITADHRQMLEHADEIIAGAGIILKILGIKYCEIGIEENKPDAIAEMQRAAEEQSDATAQFNVNVLQVKYPQGSERQLIRSITGRTVPSQALPSAVGVVVQNVSTVLSIYEAVALAKPYYEKIITISGLGITRPANLKVKIGTKISDIVDYLGGTKPELKKVVLGGPMMGFAVSTLDIPVLKTTSSVLFLTDKEIDNHPFSNCIRCGWCVQACPMGLQPNEIGVYVQAGRGQDTEPFGTLDCFECGSCAYVCPSKRPLVQFIRMAKMNLRNR